MDSQNTRIQQILASMFHMDREGRWLRLGLFVALGICGLLMFIEFGQEQSWLATGHWTRDEFSVRSDHGNATIGLMASDNQSAIELLDARRQVRARLQVNDAASSLTMVGLDRNPQIELTTSATGPMLRFFDSNRNPRVLISLLANRPEILLLDENGKAVFSAP